MGNKTQLQQHNTNLQGFVQQLENLPISNPWGGLTDIVAGKEDIVIPAYTDKQLTIKGDPDLIAANIKKGINLFGVTGTLQQGADVDFGTVTTTVKDTYLRIPTSKKRTGLLLTGLMSDYSAGKRIFTYSPIKVAYGNVNDYSSSMGIAEVTFSDSVITVKVSYSALFENIVYCAYN